MVQPGSIAEELEIEPGDELISINDQKIEDVFDYHYLVNDDYLTASTGRYSSFFSGENTAFRKALSRSSCSCSDR